MMCNKFYAALILLFSFAVNYSSAKKCPLDIKENLTGGKRDGSNIIKNAVVYSSANYFYQNNTLYGCTCSVKQCIQKCCHVGTVMSFEGCQFTTEEFVLNVSRKAEPIGIAEFHYGVGLTCPEGERNALVPAMNPNERFFIQEDGRLYIPEIDLFLASNMYCVDYAMPPSPKSMNKPILIARLCNPPTLPRFHIVGTYLFISF